MSNKRRKDGLIPKQVTYNKQTKTFYGKTEREIMQKVAAWKGEVEAGPLFKTVAEEWETEHFPTLEYNSLKNYRPAYKRALDEFGGERIKEIKPSNINSYIMAFARQGRAQKTVRTQLLILNLIFNKAVLDGQIEYNPCASVKIPKNLPKNRRELPSDEDIKAVENNLDKPFGLFAFFVLYSGCRKGEALAITHADIDKKTMNIHVTKSLYHDNNKPCIKYPKTKAGKRDIPLFDVLYAQIPKYKKEIKDKPVFCNEVGEHLTETQFQRQWELYQKETGIKCTPHQLRHAFATILFEAGVDAKDAQEILGHANLATTFDIYTHIRQERMKETIKKVNDKLNKVGIETVTTPQTVDTKQI